MWLHLIYLFISQYCNINNCFTYLIFLDYPSYFNFFIIYHLHLLDYFIYSHLKYFQYSIHLNLYLTDQSKFILIYLFPIHFKSYQYHFLYFQFYNLKYLERLKNFQKYSHFFFFHFLPEDLLIYDLFLIQIFKNF